MGNNLKLKLDSLQRQLEVIRTEVEKAASRKPGHGRDLKGLKGTLKGKAVFSEEDIREARFVIDEKL